jgi:hypothetical protein
MCCPECGSRRLFLRISESESTGCCLECGEWFVRPAGGAILYPSPAQETAGPDRTAGVLRTPPPSDVGHR